MVTEEFKVQGMHCASCGILVDETLEELSGVQVAMTSVRRGTTRVTFDPALVNGDSITEAIKEAGYLVIATR